MSGIGEDTYGNKTLLRGTDWWQKGGNVHFQKLRGDIKIGFIRPDAQTLQEIALLT